MSIEIPVAAKPFGSFTLKVLLTEDPEELEVVWTDTGEITDVLVTHTLKGRIAVKDESREEPLGNTCPFCREPVRYYAGELQNRIHCGCTMVDVSDFLPGPRREGRRYHRRGFYRSLRTGASEHVAHDHRTSAATSSGARSEIAMNI